MTEQELRALVRDAVARRLGQDVAHRSSIVQGASSGDPGPSHAVYLSLVNVGGECVIEPSVPCNHCNYCKSHGH
jgi:hypothetical protein